MESLNSILIVDDEPFLRMSLKMILAHVGYQTEEAGTATEALFLASTHHYDLIFLDLQLHEDSGLEILPKLKLLQPRAPILILTADGSLEKASLAMRMGAFEYLLKPIEPGRIITQVDDILRQQRMSSEPISPVESNGPFYPLISEKCSPQQEDTILESGDFVLDLKNQVVIVNERHISLPPCTFVYLVTLFRHAPNVVPFRVLVGEAQGYWLPTIEAQDLARWRIYRMRNALESDPGQPYYIVSEPGVGYRLNLE